MTRVAYNFWPPPKDHPATSLRSCDHPGCTQAGDYRAPKSRQDLAEYYWFCLDHVRAYNASWDFYAGCTQDEIERQIRLDATWRRPTWKLGQIGGSIRLNGEAISDAFDLFGGQERTRGPRKPANTSTPTDAAMREMDMQGPITLQTLKARYKQLCKIHHPDANGGDKDSEERFKRIGQAYRTLMDSLSA